MIFIICFNKNNEPGRNKKTAATNAVAVFVNYKLFNTQKNEIPILLV